MNRARHAAVAVVFAALTVLMTWPMARHLATEAVPHDDVYFNMWRLEWFAHALTTPGTHLFDTNIFFPARHTFAFSDAMLMEDAVAAPLLWLHVRPVLVHNVLLLGAIMLSGLAMCALASHLTKSLAAGVIAGMVFAFAPYRFEHLMHMELQWAMWSPLAFLFLHRTLETGRWQDGLATGGCVALQVLSSIYYGVFLAVLLTVAAVLMLPSAGRAPLRQVVLALALGAILAGSISAAYARPYALAHAEVGDRPLSEVISFSAVPKSYLSAPRENWLYGRYTTVANTDERQLLPGLVPVLLAMLGLLLLRPSAWVMTYLLVIALAFDLSLGLHGYTFTFLYGHIPAFRGFRALARLGLFVLLALAVLAANGYHAIAGALKPVGRSVLFAGVVIALLVEYWTFVPLTSYPNGPAAVYRVLAAQPRGVVAELPMPRADALPGYEAQHAYMSTFDWYPLVNGYSGNYPPSYLNRLNQLAQFPDPRSMRQLRRDGVRYLVIHSSQYSVADLAVVRSRLADLSITELGSFDDGDGPAFLYVLGSP
jgi:hypothetical protein